ncbi:unnamed protein product [Peronospora belbahrii]|uniref:Uncharacterized protein n=1 Tax=Peronospora belbahrii TaxID=622444 RepID=A0AAU9KL07_9STRA|nr:unnamed protein product [Peronospora belbahrii]
MVQTQFVKKVKFVRHDELESLRRARFKISTRMKALNSRRRCRMHTRTTEQQSRHRDYRHDRPQHASPCQVGQVLLG